MNTKMKIYLAAGAALVVVGGVLIFRSSGPSGPSDVRKSKGGFGIGSFFPQGSGVEEDPSAVDSEISHAKELTEEEKAENEQEFRRMKEKIPGNIFIPGELTPEEAKERRSITRDIIVYGNKVRKGTATKEEKKRYYELRVRETKDKVEFMNYIIGRVKEKGAETGKTYLDEDTIKESGDAIKKVENELKGYEEELRKI